MCASGRRLCTDLIYLSNMIQCCLLTTCTFYGKTPTIIMYPSISIHIHMHIKRWLSRQLKHIQYTYTHTYTYTYLRISTIMINLLHYSVSSLCIFFCFHISFLLFLFPHKAKTQSAYNETDRPGPSTFHSGPISLLKEQDRALPLDLPVRYPGVCISITFRKSPDSNFKSNPGPDL